MERNFLVIPSVQRDTDKNPYLCSMTSVEQLIGNLLLRHNCVIIPSFGGFVAKRVSARVDYDNGTMLPPGKSILFNRQLLNNDGLLINEFAKENQVSYDEASQELDAKVVQWQSILKEGGRIEIERVGNLFYDEERNICFEQDRFANLLLESFGLGSVHFVSEEDVRIVEHKTSVTETILPVTEEVNIPPAAQPVEQKEKPSLRPQEKKQPITPIIPIAKATPVSKKNTESPKERTDEPKSRNRAWKYVAAACVLPIAFYSIWIPVKTDVMESGMVSFSDFNPFHQRTKGTYAPAEKPVQANKHTIEKSKFETLLNERQEDNKAISYQFTDDKYFMVALPEETTATEPNSEGTQEPISKVQETPSNITFDANTMHYVVGCFGDKENADQLVASMRANGLDAVIVDVKGGLHRVSAGGAISEEAYQTIKLKADAMGLSGWRLR